MNLYLRVLIVFIAALFKKRGGTVLEACLLRQRVLPNDLDFNGHMNNGRYLTVMDLGRLDLMLRTNTFSLIWEHKSVPVLAAATIRYRLPIHVWEAYDLCTRVVCWDEKWIYIEQRFVMAKGPRAGAVAAIAIVKGGFFSRKLRTTIPTAQVVEILGLPQHSPPMPEHIAHWLESEQTLKSLTA